MNTKHSKHRDRSSDVLTYMNDSSRKNGYSPSTREIMRALGFKSTSTVDYYLDKLAAAGKIDRKRNIARGVSIRTNNSRQRATRVVDVPGFGYIKAGEPITIPAGYKISDSQFTVEIPDSYIPRGIPLDEIFALKVDGDSMRDAMIHDGDFVILHKTNQVENGDIVAAWLIDDNSTTLKRIRFTKRGVWLEPENPSSAFRKTFFLPEEIDIQGKILGIVRLYN